MKKRRIMATITAMAIAVAGLIVPASEKNGFNVKTSADFKRGGIHLSEPIPINKLNIEKILDPNSDVAKFAKTIAVGDEIQLNIFIPDLTVDLASVQLEVQYDSKIFECTQWYRDGTEPSSSDFGGSETKEISGYTLADVKKMEDNNWPYISTFGSDSDVSWTANFKKQGDDDNKKRISVTANLGTSSTDQVNVKAFNGINSIQYELPAGQDEADRIEPDGKYTVLVARFKVNSEIESATNFKTPIFSIKEHIFNSVPDDYGLGEDMWNPDRYVEATCYITGRLTGQLTKCDSAFDSEDLYIHVGFDASVLAWYQNEGVPLPDEDILVDKDGKFTIRGILPGTECTLTVHTWCLDATYTLSKFEMTTMVKDIGEWELWLYGDVNHDGYIAADDVTQVLKYIVGKPSVLTGATKNDDVYKAANVTYEKALGANDGDEVINVLDATQILRSIYMWIGNDNTSKSVFTIHSNKFLYEAFEDHAGEEFPGKTYIQ